MELHTVICCPLGVSSRRGCTFNPRNRNLFLPISSVMDSADIRVFDIQIMVPPSGSHGDRYYDAFFLKKRSAFVRDKHPENNKHKVLITLMSYNRLLTTDDQSDIVFDRVYLDGTKTSPAHLYVISLPKNEEFAFDLIDVNDERRSYSLRHSSKTNSIEVIDWQEDNLRHVPQKPTLRFPFWRYISSWLG